MKLLICDDDILTVDVIQSQLDCAALGIREILRAYNGEAAKAVIQKERPELILCDIGMPLCDGIGVLKYVHENKLDAEFTFLTCYEDFEYAKTALNYGAFGYITKPFEMAEVMSALRSMVEAATEKQLGRITQHQARHDSVVNSVLRQLSYGMYGADEGTVANHLRQNGLDIPADSRWNMVLSCTDTTDALGAGWTGELLTYTAGRLHDEVLAGYVGTAYTLIYADERYIWCRCFVPREVCTREELFARCEQLAALCSQHASLRLSILVSDEFPLYEASSVYKQLNEKMQDLKFSPGVICGIREADALCTRRGNWLDADYVLRLLKGHDSPDYEQYIRAVAERVASTSSGREDLNALRSELTYTFANCLRDNDLDPIELFRDRRVAELNSMAHQSVESLLRFARGLFGAVEEQLQQLVDSADIIARVESYIHEHFRENINRDDVAAIVYITPNYLSKLFRSKMGMNLREYINQLRIEEARRMLLTTNLSVSEIAGHVGYDNISYFSTVFRKLVGISPVDWRNSTKEGGEDLDPQG